jgi:hypothetical protein
MRGSSLDRPVVDVESFDYEEAHDMSHDTNPLSGAPDWLRVYFSISLTSTLVVFVVAIIVANLAEELGM